MLSVAGYCLGSDTQSILAWLPCGIPEFPKRFLVFSFVMRNLLPRIPCRRVLLLTFVDCLGSGRRDHVRRAEDYWVGYKLFCFAYYSHSVRHEAEFKATKLG